MLNGFGAEDEIDKIVSDLKRQHNVGVMYSGANIADADEIEGMIDQTRQEFGGVDILINNAGIQNVGPIEEFPGGATDQGVRRSLADRRTCRVPVLGRSRPDYRGIVADRRRLDRPLMSRKNA